MKEKAALSRAELERRERKYGNSLVVSGIGVIFFGLWSVLKVIEELAIGDVDFFLMLLGEDASDPFSRVMIIIIFALVVLVMLIIHYRLGRAAILVGTGKKKKFFYLILAVFLFFNIVGDFGRFYSANKDVTTMNPDDTTIAAFLVEVAFAFALLDMVISSIQIGWIRKQLERM